MTIQINAYVTVDTEDTTLIRVYKAIEAVKKHIADLETLPYDEVPSWDWHELADLRDACCYDDAYAPYTELVEHYHKLEWLASNEAYTRHYEADFRAFEEKHVRGNVFVGTQDDFDFYSDWHKDMRGYRPRGFVKIESC